MNFKSVFKPVIIGATFFALTATAAFAGMPAGVTISKDRKETSVRHRDFAYRPVLSPPKGLTMIAGNIGTYYAKAAYYPFTGETISGPDSLVGAAYTGIQFTPTADVTVKQIDTAVGVIDGPATFAATIYDDNGGVPGTALGGKNAKNVHTFGDCCDVASVKVKGVSLKAGTPYWLVLTAGKSTAWGAWAYNTTDETHVSTMAFNLGSGWIPATELQPVPSFAIYGK